MVNRPGGGGAADKVGVVGYLNDWETGRVQKMTEIRQRDTMAIKNLIKSIRMLPLIMSLNSHI